MSQRLISAFQKAKYEPEKGLEGVVWRTISGRNKRARYWKLGSFSFLGIASVLGLIPMLQILVGDFTKSGFYDYLSLTFSSQGLIFSYWKELIYSLAESLPIMSLAFSLALIFIFLLSLHFIIKQIIKTTRSESRLGGNQLSFNG